MMGRRVNTMNEIYKRPRHRSIAVTDTDQYLMGHKRGWEMAMSTQVKPKKEITKADIWDEIMWHDDPNNKMKYKGEL
jgi:hypothetical protein